MTPEELALAEMPEDYEPEEYDENMYHHCDLVHCADCRDKFELGTLVSSPIYKGSNLYQDSEDELCTKCYNERYAEQRADERFKEVRKINFFDRTKAQWLIHANNGFLPHHPRARFSGYKKLKEGFK